MKNNPDLSSREQKVIKWIYFCSEHAISTHMSCIAQIIAVPEFTNVTASFGFAIAIFVMLQLIYLRTVFLSGDFLVLCCDGIMEALSLDQVHKHLSASKRDSDETYSIKTSKPSSPSQSTPSSRDPTTPGPADNSAERSPGGGTDPVKMISRLFRDSVEAGSKDNHTAVLVSFENGSDYSRQHAEFMPGPFLAHKQDQVFVKAYKNNAQRYGITHPQLVALLTEQEGVSVQLDMSDSFDSASSQFLPPPSPGLPLSLETWGVDSFVGREGTVSPPITEQRGFSPHRPLPKRSASPTFSPKKDGEARKRELLMAESIGCADGDEELTSPSTSLGEHSLMSVPGEDVRTVNKRKPGHPAAPKLLALVPVRIREI